MKFCLLHSACFIVLLLTGCTTEPPVYSPWPPAASPTPNPKLETPNAPNIDPRGATPKLLNTAAIAVPSSELNADRRSVPSSPTAHLTPDTALPSPVIVHVTLTGSGAEWSTLGFATNYLFTALVSSDLVDWIPSYPSLDSTHSFYVTSAPPIFVEAYWQTKAQPGLSSTGVPPVSSP